MNTVTKVLLISLTILSTSVPLVVSSSTASPLSSEGPSAASSSSSSISSSIPSSASKISSSGSLQIGSSSPPSSSGSGSVVSNPSASSAASTPRQTSSQSASVATSGSSASAPSAAVSQISSPSSSSRSSSRISSSGALTSSSSSSSSSSRVASLSSTSSVVSAAPTPVRNFGKRGLSYNKANLTTPFSLSGQGSQVSWAYDWFYASCTTPGVNDCNFNPALEFVPLLYNNDPNLLSKWFAAAQIAIDNGSTALMSFNEPDYCIDGSACMNVSTAVVFHQQYMQPFAGKALIGAPAVTNAGGTDAAPVGLQYLQYFLGNCTGCTIDFINLHWYSNKYAGASYLESHINSARAIATGRPIWITEFGLNSEFSYTDAELQAFLQKAMPWMDQQPDVARYAYFMDAPGILINSAGNAISGTGIVYNSFTNNTRQPNAYT
ncbi:unnamed protein product [Aureobasidium vineae]|uniref:Asl1-like glycosyl hydrolase catalytic domain-containing protein n=1 Tax=Aureobasidium vineae TaxID=2773715 RepID=A0A9N8JGG6_9PEZI|nr:unnamed protein product [Aureobasidium vineae]